MHFTMYNLAVLTVFLVCVRFACFQQKLLNVEVFYESLCPDSLNFVANQLYPAWNELAPYVNIKFVPFGKSSSSDDESSFTCQHGPSECVGNRIMSCGLHGMRDQNLQVEYVNCFMNVYKNARHNSQELGQSCAERLGLNWDRISLCNRCQDGTTLQLEAEEATAKVNPKFIPTILYNGVFNQEAQDASLINFRDVACSFIKQVYSNAC